MQIFAGVSVGLVAVTTGYLLLTLVLSRFRREDLMGGPEIDTVFIVVPALNEERVLASTIQSIDALEFDRVFAVVVDDASEDATLDVAREHLSGERVQLLRRRLPNARTGKGEVLNHAFRKIDEACEREGIDPTTVIVGIVDADGRLEPDAMDHLLPYFDDPLVGAVQIQVRIRNRDELLGRFQDYEFLLFSSVTQTAREHLGSVGLGGNGQFARLAALRSLGDRPWTDCLTEDLDLGTRLALNGWQNRFTSETAVHQQGVDNVPALIRQRTRWMHGHFQCWRLIPRIYLSDLPTLTALDLVYYLVAPSLALVGSVVFPIPILLLVANVAIHLPTFTTSTDGLGYLAVLYGVSFGPVMALGLLYRHRARDISLLRTFLISHLLTLYSWVWYIAEWKALWRIATRRRGWAKTARVAEPDIAEAA